MHLFPKNGLSAHLLHSSTKLCCSSRTHVRRARLAGARDAAGFDELVEEPVQGRAAGVGESGGDLAHRHAVRRGGDPLAQAVLQSGLGLRLFLIGLAEHSVFLVPELPGGLL